MKPFEVGDVVVCVDDSRRQHTDSWHIEAIAMLRRGKHYRISALYEGGGVASFIGLAHPFRAWVADRFQHLPKADEAFIQQMRAIKPAKRSVEA